MKGTVRFQTDTASVFPGCSRLIATENFYAGKNVSRPFEIKDSDYKALDYCASLHETLCKVSTAWMVCMALSSFFSPRSQRNDETNASAEKHY